MKFDVCFLLSCLVFFIVFVYPENILKTVRYSNVVKAVKSLTQEVNIHVESFI